MNKSVSVELLRMTLSTTYLKGMQVGADAVLAGIAEAVQQGTLDGEIFAKHIRPRLDEAAAKFEATMEKIDGNVERTTI